MVPTVIDKSSKTTLETALAATVVLREQLNFNSAVIRSKRSSCCFFFFTVPFENPLSLYVEFVKCKSFYS